MQVRARYQFYNPAIAKILMTKQYCVRAARGWSLAYHGSCIDPMDQSKPLDPTLKVAGARRIRTIRLLVNDVAELPATLGARIRIPHIVN